MGAGGSDTGTIMFSFDTTSTTSRKYDIKVAQIPCGTNYRYLRFDFMLGVFLVFNHLNRLDSLIDYYLSDKIAHSSRVM